MTTTALNTNQFTAPMESQKQDDASPLVATVLQSQKHLVDVLGPALKKKSLVGRDNDLDHYDS